MAGWVRGEARLCQPWVLRFCKSWAGFSSAPTYSDHAHDHIINQLK